MSIKINLNKSSEDENSKTTVHYMPCKIHADCDAQVKKYMKKYIKEEENGDLTSSFRGRPLIGQLVKIPNNYKGFVLQEVPNIENGEERSVKIAHNFDELTYWNWGKHPSSNDAFIKAVDWLDIAEALHAPVK